MTPLNLRRIWSYAIGFPGFHALNMVLGILYTLVQTLIFARVLPRELFSQTIAATAVAIYLMPLNQAVARANFVLLREDTVRGGAAIPRPAAAAAFYVNQLLCVAVSLATPPLLGASDWPTYVSLACYLLLSMLTNVWVMEMQMTMMAIDRAMRFEYVNTGRRLLIFATLGWLLVDRDFLLFTVLAAAQTVAYHVWGLFRLAGKASPFGWPHGLTAEALRSYRRLIIVSFQATVAEWVGLNAPYAVFIARFGIGPELIAIDALLKLVRVVVSITRNLSEIALPRVSHALLTGQARRAGISIVLVLLASCAGALVLALAVLFNAHLTFSALLGPNNTVPAGAGPPAAIAIMSAVVFATGGHLIGHTGDERSVRWFMIAPIVASALFLALMLGYRMDTLTGLWTFAGMLLAVSAISAFVLARLVASRK